MYIRKENFALRSFCLAFIILVTLSVKGIAQNYTAFDKYITVLNGTSYTDTIFSSIDIRLLNTFNDPFGDMVITCKPVSTDNYEVKFSFENKPFLGLKMYEVKAFAAVPTISKTVRYNFEVVAALVKAKDDYIKLTKDQTNVTIAPLANDEFNDQFSKKLFLTDTKEGQGTVDKNIINYYLSKEVDQDVALYTVQNVTKNQDRGAIYIYRDKPIKSDLIKNITVASDIAQTIVLPSSFSAILLNPSAGSVSVLADQVVEYKHGGGNATQDKMIFLVNGYYLVYNIKIERRKSSTSVLKDDLVYTSVNTPVVFNAMANDDAITTLYNYSSELVHLGGGKFSYNPPSNFVGAKKFFYESGNRLYRQSAAITVNVGNIPPRDLPYVFEVAQNSNHTFSYDIPLDAYNITVTKYPLHGAATSYAQNDAILLDCGKLQGKAVVSYFPHPTYTGSDEMVVSYCTPNAPCQSYKLRYTVLPANASLCDCGTDCVWPGDTDLDGIVTPMDLLAIGRSYGLVGNSRLTQTTTWAPRPAQDWTSNAKAKYIDANGDGIIDRKDISAIVANLGKYDKLVPSPYSNDRQFPFQLVPRQTEVDSGDLVTFDIVVGNTSDPLYNAYGLGFNIKFNPGFLDSASIKTTFDSKAWFADLSPIIDFAHQTTSGNISAALSRTHDKGATGIGIIGTVTGIVKDEVQGFNEDDAPYIIQQVQASSTLGYADGSTAMAQSAPIAIKVNRKPKAAITQDDQVTLYPNPTAGDFFISLTGQDIIQSVQVYDLSGKMVKSYRDVNSKQLPVVLLGLERGVYVAKIQTNTAVVSKKVSLF